MVLYSRRQGKSTIDLLIDDHPCQGVGQREGTQRPAKVGRGNQGTIDPQIGPNGKGDRVRPLFAPAG
jgi:hypothetical protein